MPPLEVLLPLLVLAVLFLAYCLRDLQTVEATRYLPKWGWALVCVLSVPTGGLVYLAVGRAHEQHAE